MRQTVALSDARLPFADRIMQRAALVVALLLAAAACAGEREPTEAQRAARREARRDACVTDAMQRRAHANLATLDTLMASSRGEDGGVPSFVGAPHAYAAAFATYADLRAHEAAYRDSAYSAASREDSLRFARTGASFRVSRPAPGSLEENVRRSYAAEFASARQDPEHVCNLLVAEGRRGRGN